MDGERVLQGRLIFPDDIERIRALMREHPDWHRTRLSREICEEWGWRDPIGRCKDMACRTMLLKLERDGELVLPRSRISRRKHRGAGGFRPVEHATQAIEGSLRSLRPVRLLQADRGPNAELLKTLLILYHYKSFRTRVGHNIGYLAVDKFERPVGCLLFGAAAWKTAPRDEFIGWNAEERKASLGRIVNNMRFLIPPWVRVPHLASHLLALSARNIQEDWRAKYGFAPLLLETFVDLSRFRGVCYRAANWIEVGKTTGRTRNNMTHRPEDTVKSIYLYPLQKDFRSKLRAGGNP